MSVLELPGLVDLQVNGAAGHDLTADPGSLWDVAAALPAHGVTAFCPTLVTADPAVPRRALEVLAAGPPEGWRGAVPLGWHVEGPMINPARKGAHPERWLRAPSLDLVEGWSPETGVLMVTLAPELPGALEVVEALAARGVVVGVGHTEATAEQVDAAVAAGARCLTHLGNAMPPMTAREPGPVGAALGGHDLVAGLIVDGHHLDPHVVRAAWRALGPSRFWLVSDTTAALGLPDGETRLGDQTVHLRGGAVRLADGTLAGSAAGLLDGLRTLAATVGLPLEEVAPAATTTPLALVGAERPGDRLVLVDGVLEKTVVDGADTWERSRPGCG